MKKIITVILFALMLATPSFAQSAKLLPQKITEGSTAFLTVAFYDQENQPVAPKAVWFAISSNSGTAMQATKSLIGGTGDTSFFVSSSMTPIMNLIITPCANRIETEAGNSQEINDVHVWFAYPSTCTLASSSGSDVCKYGVGDARYEKRNINGVIVRKGTAPCDGWAETVGCPISSTATCSTNCSVCAGTE